MKCIYCVEDKPISSFTKVEHIIPQSFGLFKNNLTLRREVCDDCNQYFGDNLEIVLARDTFEGSSRFEFKLQKPTEFKSFGKKSRMVIKVAEGEYEGAYAYRDYSQEEDRVVIKPAPQIGFLKVNSFEYKYFLLDEIPDKIYLDKNGFEINHPKAIRILGMNIEKANSVLSQKGIGFVVRDGTGPSEHLQKDCLCEVDATMDLIIFRAIAKIAFNYLAYWEGPDFVLHGDFNAIRRFILKGEQMAYPLIRVDDRPILGDEPIEGERRLGHIITLNWASDKVSIVSQVSLLNWATYTVCLAKDFSGQYRNLRRGHFFYTYDQEILDLEAR